MSLKDDIDQIKQLWADSTWVMKIIMVLTLFISSSSLASLSDVVFEWKGFIQDGVQFYTSWIMKPILTLLEVIGLKLTLSMANYIVMCSLMIAGYFKAYWTGRDNVTNKLKFSILVTLFVSTVVIGVIGSYTYDEGENFDYSYALFNMFIVLVIVAPVIFFILKCLRQSIKFNFTAYYVTIGVPIMVVLILGAINTGLLYEA